MTEQTYLEFLDIPKDENLSADKFLEMANALKGLPSSFFEGAISRLEEVHGRDILTAFTILLYTPAEGIIQGDTVFALEEAAEPHEFINRTEHYDAVVKAFYEHFLAAETK